MLMWIEDVVQNAKSQGLTASCILFSVFECEAVKLSFRCDSLCEWCRWTSDGPILSATFWPKSCATKCSSHVSINCCFWTIFCSIHSMSELLLLTVVIINASSFCSSSDEKEIFFNEWFSSSNRKCQNGQTYSWWNRPWLSCLRQYTSRQTDRLRSWVQKRLVRNTRPFARIRIDCSSCRQGHCAVHPIPWNFKSNLPLSKYSFGATVFKCNYLPRRLCTDLLHRPTSGIWVCSWRMPSNAVVVRSHTTWYRQQVSNTNTCHLCQVQLWPSRAPCSHNAVLSDRQRDMARWRASQMRKWVDQHVWLSDEFFTS